LYTLGVKTQDFTEKVSVQKPRLFTSLRVSLTQNCNLACNYCTDSKSGNFPYIDYREILDDIINLHGILNLKKIRITGGEPLLFPGLMPLLHKIRAVSGIKNITLTTNGVLLKKNINKLIDAGIGSINISLDSLNPSKYQYICGNNQLSAVLDSIDKALKSGLKIKINSVIMRGINDSEIKDLTSFAADRNIIIRFIELMNIGVAKNFFQERLFTEGEILSVLREFFTMTELDRNESSTARYWNIDEKKRVGIIANHSRPFCGDCNRLRLDSQGYIYGCLSSNSNYYIRNQNFENLKDLLVVAMGDKQKTFFTGSNIIMKAIGG